MSKNAGSRRRLGRLARSNTVVVLLGKTAMTVAQGVILLALARLEDARAVGLYTLALAIVTPIFLLAHLRMQDVLGTHEDARGAWRSHLRVLVGAGLMGVGAALLVGLAWPTEGLGPVLALLAVVKFAESLSFACHGVRATEGRFRATTNSNISRAVLTTGGLVLGLATGGLVLGMALMAVGALLQLLVDMRGMPWAADRRVSERLLRSLIPLGLVAMLLSLNQSFVRVIVERYAGVTELAAFAIAAYLVRAGSVIAQSVAHVSAPALSRARADSDRVRIRALSMRSAMRGFACGLALAVVAVPFGPTVISLLYGEDLRPSHALVAGVMAAGVPLFASTALSSSMVALRRNRSYLSVVACSLLLTVAMALVAVPEWGLLGGTFAWAAGEWTKLVLMVTVLWSATRTVVDGSATRKQPAHRR